MHARSTAAIIRFPFLALVAFKNENERTPPTLVMSQKVKILLVGPEKSGKSSIANFLGSDGEGSIGSKDAPYRPTAGVRVVEFETSGAGTFDAERASSTSLAR